MESIFGTEKHFTLSDLLPENRDVVFISTSIGTGLQPMLSLVRSLCPPSDTREVGIFDMHELARELSSLSSAFSPSIAKLLYRLYSPELGVDVTEFLLRSALLPVLESCEIKMRDEVGIVWVHCLKDIGAGNKIEKGPLETVRNGVKVGNVISKGVQRSKEEIERVRAERVWKRYVGCSVELADELRHWDGMWELID